MEAKLAAAELEVCRFWVLVRMYFGTFAANLRFADGAFKGHKEVTPALKRNGSSGRTRTYNPPVNSRFLPVGVYVISMT